ncbi:type 1 glutamine amidotransferase domain-containing protein [Massilia glaciei]|uniref:Type 1 glutamine amidotransferase domain-containing protein n=1 Tax=Massilia glaciei TaxID=1524097 RepID=A0A2U2I701_9BURK|nr:type 1 glutamine amidotransferase domain-containing protein [Massilia glaciei]PWF55527.1 type 1 glutamine amidotransferase domain-containing protein [Massilia glaciei]
MLKKILRGVLWALGTLMLLSACGYGYWQGFGLDERPKPNTAARAADLDLMKNAVAVKRGRILAVVSSTPRIGGTNKKAGYELTELSRAYYTFRANGYEVDIASPRGGVPPVDEDDMGEADFAFLNDAGAQDKVANSIPLAKVDSAAYAAVYFVGGKGAMFDFADNPDIDRIVRDVYRRGVVGAVCHGPAALLNVKLDNGKPLIAGKRMTAFSNAEELFLMENAHDLFGFLVEDRASAAGARFVAGPQVLDNTVVDGRLVTGQNPWSTWSVAEAMITALGHAPVARRATAEEVNVHLLATYYRSGLAAARAERDRMAQPDRQLVLMHAIVAGMQWRLVDAFNLQRLARRQSL